MCFSTGCWVFRQIRGGYIMRPVDVATRLSFTSRMWTRTSFYATLRPRSWRAKWYIWCPAECVSVCFEVCRLSAVYLRGVEVDGHSRPSAELDVGPVPMPSKLVVDGSSPFARYCLTSTRVGLCSSEIVLGTFRRISPDRVHARGVIPSEADGQQGKGTV